LALAELGKTQTEDKKRVDQINREIEIAKYKVDRENVVFHLATDRVQLEMQLAAVQKQVIDYDMKRIIALAQLMAGVQTPGNLDRFLDMAGMAPDLKALFEKQFQAYGRYGFTNVQTQ
jgi:hypothetical protein